MTWIMVGLGNPGNEYVGTRHNVGRDTVAAISSKFPTKVKVLLPDTYMNDSGKAIGKIVKSKKAAEELVVLHDELDLPLGKIKISFGSGSGGHKGVESVQKTLKTRDFIRIRIGISPTTSSGKLKKPDADDVIDFVLGKFKPGEQEKVKKVRKQVGKALELLFDEGLARAMTEVNSK